MKDEVVFDFDRKPLRIKDDPPNGVIEIEGIRYSYELLKGIGRGLGIGKVFRILERGDGVVTVEVIHQSRILPESEERLNDSTA